MWMQITAGRGPVECQWVVGRLLGVLVEEAGPAGVRLALLEAVPGEAPDTLRSALLSVEGDGAAAFIDGLAGTIQWVGRSPLRPHHRRRNFFVGVEGLRPPERLPFSERDLRIDTLRSSGPGGQHVNKTESCVRVLHLPTGLMAIAREERSQQQNRRLALARLAGLLADREQQAEAGERRRRWEEHNTLERGNAVRVYEGERFLRRAGP
jgi:peptide chain release factor